MKKRKKPENWNSIPVSNTTIASNKKDFFNLSNKRQRLAIPYKPNVSSVAKV